MGAGWGWGWGGGMGGRAGGWANINNQRYKCKS